MDVWRANVAAIPTVNEMLLNRMFVSFEHVVYAQIQAWTF